MNQAPLIRWLLLAVAVVVTFSTLVLALPSEAPKLELQGAAAVNQAPAIRIKLASPAAPKAPAPKPEKPEAKPEPEPEPEPKPKPEPKPDPKPEPKPEPEPEPEPKPEPRPEPEPAPEPVPEVTKDVARAEPAKTVEASEAPTEKQAEQENLSQQVELTAGNSAAVDSYLTKLGRHLSRFYEYPRRSRRLGQEGSPVIVFEFSRSGELVQHSLSQSSSHKLLDEAALDMLKAAEPLPEVPESMQGKTFTYALPVRFSLR